MSKTTSRRHMADGCQTTSGSFLATILAACGWLLLAANSQLQAYERFSFDQAYLVDAGNIVKDHSVVQTEDGTYHIFYIRAPDSTPGAQVSLGHATSTDLKHWTFHPDVIFTVPNSWEENQIWAPQVFYVNDEWVMLYTGVNRFFAQATGLATSPDLFNWTKHPGNPVYSPDPSWASWDYNTWSNCRDPFAFFHAGQWHLLNTAHTSDLKGAIAYATSTDLINWTDQGPLFVHPGPNAWHVLESANLHLVNGAWHLTFTEQNVGGSSYLQADDLTGPWDYAVRQPFDAGHATELFQLDGGDWWLSRHTTFAFGGAPRYVIKFDRVLWNTPDKPTIVWSDPLEGWTIWSGNAFYLQPAFWDNSLERTGEASNFLGNSWIGTYEAFTGPLQIGFPGLGVGEDPVGILRSKTWWLSGNRLSFMIGGGNDIDNLYLALYTASDDVLRLKATGSDSDAMQEVTWDVSSWVGQPVYLQVVDQSQDAWGHVNVDEIVEWDTNTSTDTENLSLPSARLLANTPNPFNPSTRIHFDLVQADHVRLAIFDVLGNRLRDLLDGPLGPGRHHIPWDGLTADGRRAPSGVYYARLQLESGFHTSRAMVLVK